MHLFYQRATTFFKTKAAFLLLLPLFFIYSGYNELFGFLSIQFIATNMIAILIGIAIVWLIAFFFFKQKDKASVFTFFLTLFCLVFGFIHDSLKQFNSIQFVSKFTILLPLAGLLFILLFIYLRKRKQSFTELYLFLNLLFVILLLSEIPNSIKRYQLDRSVHNLIDFRFNALQAYQPAHPVADSAKPDIYFLLFDALSSSKSLKAEMGQDNYLLDSFLLQKGFYVAANARANYNWTIHSMSSTLNMDYLPAWIAPAMNDPKAYFWGSASILNNSLFSILKKEGYTVHSYQPVSYDNPDWPGASYFNSLRENHYYYKTLPGRIYRDIFWNYSKIDIPFIEARQFNIIEARNQEKKQYFDTTIALIKNSCSNTGTPKMIYGHFMLPHEPYTFDSSGQVQSVQQTIIKNRKEDELAYYHQIIFAGKVIRDLVQYIQVHNRKNTVIIVAGDHGYRSSEGDKSGYTFQNMNAIYFPDQQYQYLYDSLTPVNTFRIVLNKYFTAGLPLLKDSSTLVTQQKETIRKSEKISPTHTP